MKAHVLAWAALLTAASPSAASVLTVAGSDARSCFSAAEAREATLENLHECDRALAFQPLSELDRLATYVNRGILRMLRGDLAQALADYDVAIAMNPNHPEAYINKAVIVFDSGDTKTAVELAEKAMALGTRKPGVAYYIRALAKEEAGDVKAAYQDLLQAAKLEPSWSLPQQDLKRYRTVSR